MYISYLRDFLVGKVGDLTYDFEPGHRVAGRLRLPDLGDRDALAIWRRRDWFDANRVAFIALAGLSLYGLIQFSYFDNRSLATILPFLCFPAASLGDDLAGSGSSAIPEPGRRSAGCGRGCLEPRGGHRVNRLAGRQGSGPPTPLSPMPAGEMQPRRRPGAAR